jgi:hypothetical protein
MAGAGKKLQDGGARTKARSPAAQVSDGGYGRPPHPIRVVPGQIFFPRHAHGRRRLLEIRSVEDDRARAKRLDGPRETLTVNVARLLAVRADGQGHYYSFQGWRPGTYRTWAQVVMRREDRATLALPEWHPARTVSVPEHVLPLEARDPGDSLWVTADLSASNPARLRLLAREAITPTGGSGPPRRRQSAVRTPAANHDGPLGHRPIGWSPPGDRDEANSW